MEIVIKIDKDYYEMLKHEVEHGHDFKPYNLIANGTPLPEHHGRLIDISEYEKYFNTAIIYDDGNHEHVVYTDTVPTIIEADKCTYKETGCGSCKKQLYCPIEAEGSDEK